MTAAAGATASIRPEVRDAPAYVFRAFEADVKLDQNEAPADLPAPLKERILQRLHALPWHRYPEIRARSVAEALAERDGWDPAGIVVAPGSNVLIQAACIAAGLGRHVVTVAPTFAVYAQQAKLLGCRTSEVPLTADFALDVDALTTALRDGPGVLFLADPAAPTGNRHHDGAFAEVLNVADSNGFLTVVDEAYWNFDGRDRLASVRDHPQRVSLRTFSKADGVGGVRLGYALAAPPVAQDLGKVLLPFDVSALQAAIARELVNDADAQVLREARIATIRRERERLADAMERLPGVQVHRSVTNFLLFRVADPAALHAALLRQSVLVRRQDHLPGLAGALRVTVGDEAQNDAFLSALTAVLPEVPHG